MDLVKNCLIPDVNAGSCGDFRIALYFFHGYEYQERNGELCYEVLWSLTFKPFRN